LEDEMVGRFSFLVGLGAGYVLGARSGRERYEQIADRAQRVWRDPRVQAKAGQAQRVVQEKAGQAGQVVQEKAGHAGHVVKEKVASTGSSDGDYPTQRPDTGPGVASTTTAGSAGTVGGTLP
jgi:hypothetical protein